LTDALKPFHPRVCLTAHPYYTMRGALRAAAYAPEAHPIPPSPEGDGPLGVLLWCYTVSWARGPPVVS